MEIEIGNIKRISEEKEDENWEFRSFLKNQSSKKVDAAAHELYRKFSSEIDCRTCSNCCKVMSPILDEKDIEILASTLHLTQEVFKERYVLKDDEDDGYRFKTKPCPFLGVDGCSQYEHRPKDCRAYPHLHKTNFNSRLMGVIENCSVCPIVFNVYESLKNKLWHR